MIYAQRSMLFLLVSSVLAAQDGLPASPDTTSSYSATPAFHWVPTESNRILVRSALGLCPSCTLTPSATYSRSASAPLLSAISPIPLAFSLEPPQNPSQPSAPPLQPPAPKRASWARRHVLLLTGLALTGAGVPLVATGGNGNFYGCGINAGTGQTECTTASTWGASGRHLGGLLLLCTGVPIAIVGLFKHQ